MVCRFCNVEISGSSYSVLEMNFQRMFFDYMAWIRHCACCLTLSHGFLYSQTWHYHRLILQSAESRQGLFCFSDLHLWSFCFKSCLFHIFMKLLLLPYRKVLNSFQTVCCLPSSAHRLGTNFNESHFHNVHSWKYDPKRRISVGRNFRSLHVGMVSRMFWKLNFAFIFWVISL